MINAISLKLAEAAMCNESGIVQNEPKRTPESINDERHGTQRTPKGSEITTTMHLQIDVKKVAKQVVNLGLPRHGTTLFHLRWDHTSTQQSMPKLANISVSIYQAWYFRTSSHVFCICIDLRRTAANPLKGKSNSSMPVGICITAAGPHVYV